VSGFAHNLARRAAGFEPGVTVRPSFVPNFPPALPIRLWRPTPSPDSGVGDARELPPLTASSRPLLPELDRRSGQEMPPTRVSTSERTYSPVASSLMPHLPIPDSGSPAPGQRTDGQPSTKHSPAQPQKFTVAGKNREPEPRLSYQGEIQQHSQQRAQIPASPRVGSSSDETAPGSWSAPPVQSLPKGSADSSRAPSQDVHEQHVPTIRGTAPRLTDEGSNPEAVDDMPPAPPTGGSSPEGRAAFEPGLTPATQSSSPASAGSPRIRVASSEEATEQYTPVVRARAARQIAGGTDPAPVETTQRVSQTQHGEPAAEPGPAALRSVQPSSSEPATRTQPASSVAARQASVIRPEPAALPSLLQRPTAQAEGDSIHVRIGTVEVRATTPPPAPSPAPAPQGFGDYAAVRSYVGWERI